MQDFDYLANVYRRLNVMIQMHLADMTDADLLARPVEGANHAAYQVGHLVNSTTRIINSITPDAMPALPEEFSARHSGGGAKLNEGFDTKQRLLDRFAQMTDAAVAWVQRLSDDEKAKATPAQLQGMAKTVGEMAVMLTVHMAMHIGQVQVIRRKLDKPVLF